MEDADTVQLAIVVFNAYGEHCAWKAWDGRPMPKWSASDWPDGTPAEDRREVNDAVRSHWIAAAKAAKNHIAMAWAAEMMKCTCSV